MNSAQRKSRSAVRSHEELTRALAVPHNRRNFGPVSSISRARMPISSSETPYDLAIVGASIAGCSAAVLFARHGFRVALIERNPDANAYKRVCTHFILSCAIPTIRRLGLCEPLERAGAVRNGAQFWTRWGWIRPPDTREDPRAWGYNIRRSKLDPLFRNMAINSPGVEYFPGESACALLEEAGRVTGVELEKTGGANRSVRARLVVGADGRQSLIGRLSGLPQTVKPNHRVAFFTYFRDLTLATGKVSQMWLFEPDMAYAFPNDDGVTLVACMPHKDRLAEFKKDLGGSFYRFFASVPDAPPIDRAKQVSTFFSMADMPNMSRPASRPGLALIGDAALASDPVWGVGCGWAFQSAEWLADHAAEALKSGNPARLDGALEKYRNAHRSALAGHHSLICDYSARKKLNALERLIFSAAARDPATARHFENFGNRRISVGEFLAPRALARAVRVNLTSRRNFRN